MKTLAQKIARELFTNGAKQRAQRLVLELKDGKNGGGWCEQAVVDTIEKYLSKKHNAQTTAAKKRRP